MAEPAESPIPPQGGTAQGVHCRSLQGLETPVASRLEIQMLSHRLGEHRERAETREIGMIDGFSLRKHSGVGPRVPGSGTGVWEAPIFILTSAKAGQKPFREQKPHRAN